MCRVDLLLLLFTNEACFEGYYSVARESASCQKINVTRLTSLNKMILHTGQLLLVGIGGLQESLSKKKQCKNMPGILIKGSVIRP